VPRNADAVDAELQSNELFRFPLLGRTLVVQRDPDGLSAPAQARAARRALTRDEYPGLRGVAFALPVTNAAAFALHATVASTPDSMFPYVRLQLTDAAP
jgi:hypothetical protein